MDWRVENKYSHWYDKLMQKARDREIEKPYERHHVVPKCFGVISTVMKPEHRLA